MQGEQVWLQIIAGLIAVATSMVGIIAWLAKQWLGHRFHSVEDALNRHMEQSDSEHRELWKEHLRTRERITGHDRELARLGSRGNGSNRFDQDERNAY